MSKFRDTQLLLNDMYKAVQKSLLYTDTLTYEQFCKDEKTIDAVLHNIQILGEAAKQIPADFRDGNSTIEWEKIIRSRHILVHNYHEIDKEIIWKIIENYLPPLKTSLEEIMTKF